MKRNSHVDLSPSDPLTSWEPEIDPRKLLLAAILRNNPIPAAYRVNYVANFYVGPLVRMMEDVHGLTRSEWIVLFCLHQQSGLNAQQISNVTGRPKTSLSTAVNQLSRKKLIERHTDARDGRRQVLRVTDTGHKLYKAILRSFETREAEMLECLDRSEREMFIALLDKIIDNGGNWARPY